MDLEKLCNNHVDLIQHMQNDGYTDDYVKRLKTDINWLKKKQLIKRQKCVKKKLSGLTRETVAAILEAPDQTTQTGKRDIVFLTILYATAGRLDEVQSIKFPIFISLNRTHI